MVRALAIVASLACLAAARPVAAQVEWRKAGPSRAQDVAFRLTDPAQFDGKRLLGPRFMKIASLEVAPVGGGGGQVLRGSLEARGPDKIAGSMDVDIWPHGGDRTQEFYPGWPMGAVGPMVFERLGAPGRPDLTVAHGDQGTYSFVMPLDLPPGRYLVRARFRFEFFMGNGPMPGMFQRWHYFTVE
jgi:hypothetical protein